ncbi:MAG: hypothetical protein AMXMBFR64_04490 [Myxococcales bacterium]
MADLLTSLARELERDGAALGVSVCVGDCRGRRAVLDVRRGGATGHLALTPREPGSGAQLRGAALDGDLTWDGAPDARLEAWIAARAARALGSVALARAIDAGEYDPRSILDVGVETLVERGLKPSARLAVAADADLTALEARVPVVVSSRGDFAFTRQGRLDLAAGGRRFVYLGHDRGTVERLRDIDEVLFSMRGLLGDPARSRALRREQGLLLGYPRCCVEWFAAERPATAPRDELWDLAEALGWDGLVVDPRLGFVASVLTKIPVLPHVPCSASCDATARQTGAWIRALYSPWCARVVLRLLATSVALWPDGRLVPFALDGVEGGALRVRDFNRTPWPELMTEAWSLRRLDGAEAVDAIRRDGGLSVRVEGQWRPWGPPGRPLLLLFGSGARGGPGAPGDGSRGSS